jgi:hypothetical protein
MFVGLIESALSGYVPNIGTSLGTARAFVLVVVVLACVRKASLNCEASRHEGSSANPGTRASPVPVAARRGIARYRSLALAGPAWSD